MSIFGLSVRLRGALVSAVALLLQAKVEAQLAVAGASSILTVTSAADRGPGTLREAMELANADGVPTTIRFAIGGDLLLDSILPPIADRDRPTTIDGTTAPSRVRIRGSAGNRGSALWIISPGTVLRSVDFHDIDFDCINLLETADGTVFEDVAITACRRGIGLVLLGCDDCRFVGLRVEGNASTGIYARDGADRNLFGLGLRVLGNVSGGIVMRACHQNQFVGTQAAPLRIEQNNVVGLGLLGGSSDNLVGPWISISGGAGNGVRISDPLTARNIVQAVTVSGVSGHSFSLGYGTSDNLLTSCAAADQSLSGFLIETRAQRNRIDACSVQGRASSASGLIALTDAPDNAVTGCTVRGRGTLGSSLNAFGLTVTRSPRIAITRCDFGNLQNYGIGIAAGSHGCSMNDCTISNAGGVAPALGVNVQGVSGTPLTGILLLDVRALGPRDAGFSLQHVADPQLVACTVQSAANVGVRIGSGAERVIVDGCLLDGSGATGVSLDGARSTQILRSTIRGYGNGVFATLHLGDLRMEANRVIGNRQSGVVLAGVPAFLANNLFDANDIGVGTLNSSLPNTRLIHNTLVYNRIGLAGGGELWGSIFWFNGLDMTPGAVTWAAIRSNLLQAGNPRIGIQGNISVAPVFVNPTSSSGDFHLSPVPQSLIDAGDPMTPGLPSTDFDGQARVQGSAPDLGMDELR